MEKSTGTSVAVLTLAAALAWVPVTASAQALTPLAHEATMCIGDLSPASVQAGEKAVAVTVQVSEMMGEVTGVEAGEDSGILLASLADLPKTEMARSTAGGATAATAERTINKAEASNTWIVWLNVAEAEVGPNDVTFTSEQGECTSHLVVAPRA